MQYWLRKNHKNHRMNQDAPMGRSNNVLPIVPLKAGFATVIPIIGLKRIRKRKHVDLTKSAAEVRRIANRDRIVMKLIGNTKVKEKEALWRSSICSQLYLNYSRHSEPFHFHISDKINPLRKATNIQHARDNDSLVNHCAADIDDCNRSSIQNVREVIVV